tara:strand:- start:173 stop:538 length:366 start_codon:yes stop_codon:yes gene_type:complete
MELNDLIKQKYILQLEMNELDIKINKIKQDNIKKYSCKKCDVEIDTKDKYIRHMNSKQHNPDSNPITCSLCSRKFYNVKVLRFHEEDGSCARARTCKKCGKIFSCVSSKNRHIRDNKCSRG